jgi:hypothetical protein
MQSSACANEFCVVWGSRSYSLSPPFSRDGLGSASVAALDQGVLWNGPHSGTARYCGEPHLVKMVALLAICCSSKGAGDRCVCGGSPRHIHDCRLRHGALFRRAGGRKRNRRSTVYHSVCTYPLYTSAVDGVFFDDRQCGRLCAPHDRAWTVGSPRAAIMELLRPYPAIFLLLFYSLYCDPLWSVSLLYLLLNVPWLTPLPLYLEHGLFAASSRRAVIAYFRRAGPAAQRFGVPMTLQRAMPPNNPQPRR